MGRRRTLKTLIQIVFVLVFSKNLRPSAFSPHLRSVQVSASKNQSVGWLALFEILISAYKHIQKVKFYETSGRLREQFCGIKNVG
jgi:hypothetical protein